MLRFMTVGVPALLLSVIPLPAQNRGAVGTRIDSALSVLEAKGFSGVVRVEKDGVTLLNKGYGLATRAETIPFTPSTVVQIGSNTKDFTVVALLQLYEQKRLNINDPITKYFPDVPPEKRAITLWQLVTHRAGFPIVLGGDFEPVTRQQLVKRAMNRRLAFPPGTSESYSNTGYALLAAVIEQVSGKSYDQYVRDNILVPMKLKDTGFLLPRFDQSRVAHGYQRGSDKGTMLSRPHAADGPFWNLRGNGGMLSTVPDMHEFYAAIFDGDKLLKPATARLRFPRDEPIALAGSDLVSGFLYERVPQEQIELIVATNSAEWRERTVRNAIAGVLGLPSPDGPSATSAGPRPNAHAPSSAVGSMLAQLVRAISSGDRAAIRAFIIQHSETGPGKPSVEQRAERMLSMHDNLGEIKLARMDQVDSATVEMSLTSQKLGPLTMKVLMTGGVPARIRAVQILVGG